jgi:integrase/recombinase XerD
LSGFACPLNTYENTLQAHKLFGEMNLATAKALTAAEVQQVLDYTAKHNYAQRNKLMFLMTVAAGLRVGEVACLTIGDVRNEDGTVRGEVFLAADRVKHGHARTVYINTRLQAELAEYINERKWLDSTQPLFYTHRGPRRAFSPNTLAQHFHYVYKRVGIKQGGIWVLG